MREAMISRTTRETDISLSLNLDGTGKADIHTGCGFLDHMLELLTFHGSFDLTVTCKGDTHVDDHHTVEDIGIALGQAFFNALGEKKGIVILRNPSDKAQSYKLVLDEVLEMPGAAKASKFMPTVIFNSSAEYENTNSPNAFKPIWPRSTAHEVEWVLPPFATILFEVAF